MKNLFYLAALLLLFSCQIEDDNAPKPDDSYIKYLGEIADQQATDIEPIYAADGTTLDGFVIFGTQKRPDSLDSDYYIVRTDAVGNIVAEETLDPRRPHGFIDFDGNGAFDDILTGNETAGQIEVLPGGGFLIIGTTSVTDQSKNLVDFQFITVARLDDNLQEIGSISPINPNTTRETPLNLIGNDIIQLADGSLLIVGAIETVAGDLNNFYVKFDANNSLVWTKTSGLAGSDKDDVLVRAFETANQTLALFGYSERVGNRGQVGTNVSYLEVNQNGNPTGGSGNFGIPDTLDANSVLRVFNDVVTDVIEKPGGYMAVGTTTIDASSFAFFMDIDFDGISNRKGRILSEFDRTLNTEAFGVSITRTNDFVVVGKYTNFRVGTEQRGEEAMFVRINQTGEKVAGFESNYGLGDGNDNAADVITLSDGKIVVATTIDFGGGIRMIGLMKLNDTGELDR